MKRVRSSHHSTWSVAKGPRRLIADVTVREAEHGIRKAVKEDYAVPYALSIFLAILQAPVMATDIKI